MAFNAMNIEPNDRYITGGSLLVSEYENEMTPTDQKNYEDTLLQTFKSAWLRDPYKQNLNFKQWLGALNFDLYRQRADNWEEIKAKKNGNRELFNMDPVDANLLEDAGTMQRLAHLHTGRLEDLVEIIDSYADQVTSERDMSSPQQQPLRDAGMRPGMPNIQPVEGPSIQEY